MATWGLAQQPFPQPTGREGRKGGRPASRSTLVAPFAAAVGVRVLIVIAIHILHGPFLFLDDRGYDKIGWEIAQAWQGGSRVQAESVEFAGSISYGYFVYVATIYFIFGHIPILVGLINAILSSLSVVFGANIAHELGGPRLRARAAWLLALYPIAVFWGSTSLKDGPLASLFLAVVMLSLRPLSLRRVLIQLIFVLIAFLSRLVLGIVSLLIMAVPIAGALFRRSGERRRKVGGPLLAALAFGLIALVVGPRIQERIESFQRGLESEGTGELAFESVVQLQPSTVPVHLVRAMLGPFPWAYGPGTESVYRWMYPGMVVWIALLPCAVIGGWMVLRKSRLRFLPVLTACIVYLAFYFSVFTNEGFYRQRFGVEAIFLILALWAYQVRPHLSAVCTLFWIAIVALAALVYTGSVPPAAAPVLVGIGLLPLAVDKAVHGVLRRRPRRFEG